MTDLYLRPGTVPHPLPFDAYDGSLRLWTDLASSEEGRVATGWNRPAPPRPDETEAQAIEWDGETEDWIMVDRPPAPEPSLEQLHAAINLERDRRMVAGFQFMRARFQSRPEDRENIMGAFALASTAMTIGGKQPGDLRWHGGQEDFVFIAEDDSRVPMDALAVLGLGQAAAAQKSALTFAANDLKKLDPIPSDFVDDAYWPSAG